MALTPERLTEATVELLSRPGHEKVRSILYDLLVNGLEVPSAEIDFERPLPEVRGRADALLGNSIFEVKRDLRREQGDAEEELTRYLTQRETETGRRFLGIATDGARFLVYQLRNGVLESVGPSFSPVAEMPRRLLAWLDQIVAVREELEPTPTRVRSELGRQSLSYLRARQALGELWAEVGTHPDTHLKRELWADLLQRVYGSRIDQDELWFQHTYLTVVAKAMALRVLDMPVTDAADLLSGRPFSEVGINGAVESDFFDWLLDAGGGADLVMRIAHQVARFRLIAVEHDIGKVLYESLIDPEERHELGEFYTPDWLADLICEASIERPTEERVLDPACGSGTFPFFALRRLLAAADDAGLSNRAALDLATEKVLGIDIHPVAVLIARVTYLLALGSERLRQERSALTIPIYLGDSLQWNTASFLAGREVLIQVPDGGPTLLFPFVITRDPNLFDRVIEEMLSLSERGADGEVFAAWLRREGITDIEDFKVLGETYRDLRQLQADDRNHIWGYVARNLSRPIWLSTDEQRADVVVGNPPWLAYRFMSDDLQKRFREQSLDRGLWAGGKLATHQDLSALFFVRAVELYLRPGGRIAMVMPLAALSRQQFAGFRTGLYQSAAEMKMPGRRRPTAAVAVSFEQPWALDERVFPLFPVPASVVFATDSTPVGGPIPATARAFAGLLPRRDAARAEAMPHLSFREEEIAILDTAAEGSPYRERFRQGTTIVPQMFWMVDRVRSGALGGNRSTPLLESRRNTLEKKPWRDLPPLRGQVEAEFLANLYMGRSVAPYRLLESRLALIPWSKEAGRVLTAASAGRAGYPRLAAWLDQAEKLWREHGRSEMDLADRIDYNRALTSQMTGQALRVVYAASGTLPAAALLRDPAAVIEHKLYWAAVETEEEAHYLEAILNSETARLRVAPLQSRGQWGARDLDKLMLSLPLPSFDPGVDLHRRLAEATQQAEAITVGLDLTGLHFVKARQTIRAALVTAGVAAEIDALVGLLLGDAPFVAVEPTLDSDLEMVVFDEDELEGDETIPSEDANDKLIDV